MMVVSDTGRAGICNFEFEIDDNSRFIEWNNTKVFAWLTLSNMHNRERMYVNNWRPEFDIFGEKTTKLAADQAAWSNSCAC